MEESTEDRGNRRDLRLAVSVIAIVVGTLLFGRLFAAEPLKLPPEAVPLELIAQPEPPTRLFSLGCQAALVNPVRVGQANGRIAFYSVSTGQEVPLKWPYGWSGWLVDGRAHLVAREGFLYALEGDVLDDLVGAYDTDANIRVCFSVLNPARPRR